MATAIKTPNTFSEALRLAADLVEKNAELETQLADLRMNREYPEVLRPQQIMKLMNVSKSKVSEWCSDSTFPVLNQGRKKGESVLVLKSDLYHWLKTRKEG